MRVSLGFSTWAPLQLQSDWIRLICCAGDANYPEATVVCVNQNQYACKLGMAQFIWVHPSLLTSSQSLIQKALGQNRPQNRKSLSGTGINLDKSVHCLEDLIHQFLHFLTKCVLSWQLFKNYLINRALTLNKLTSTTRSAPSIEENVTK